MKRIILPVHTGCHLPFYLAAEEWVARSLPPDDYFFLWRVNPTVICGRNQDILKEVNVRYCNEHDIEVVRRKSGGGCVYADLNNWMVSYITHSDEVTTTFSRFTTLVAQMLRSLGLDACATGRNDILVAGRKISGNSFYHFPGRSIAHGTILHTIDYATMSQAITPSRAKLESKAVSSVQSRVTSLSAEGLKMSVEEFGEYANRFLSENDGEIVLDPVQIAEIEFLTKEYYNPHFRWGRAGLEEEPRHVPAIQRQARIDGVGEFSIGIDTDEANRIRALSVEGDFFITGDLDCELIAPLMGVEYTRPALTEAVAGVNPEAAVAGLSRDDFFSLLF